MYQIIGHPNSRASRLAWCLEELGQPYDYVPVMPHDAAIRAITPRARCRCCWMATLQCPTAWRG